MKPLILAAFFLVLLATPAHAGWFDFGVGEIAKATGKIGAAKYDAQVKLALIKAVARAMPMILLLVTLVGAIVSGWAAAYLAMRLHDTARTSLKDGRVSVSEWIILLFLSVITLPICAGLLWFGYFLMTAAQAGMMELAQ